MNKKGNRLISHLALPISYLIISINGQATIEQLVMHNKSRKLVEHYLY